MPSAPSPTSDRQPGGLHAAISQVVAPTGPQAEELQAADGACRVLACDLASQPLQQALFPRHAASTVTMDRRVSLMQTAYAAYAGALARLGVDVPSLDLFWSLVLPLAEYAILRRRECGQPPVIGLVGGPGAGKTTLAYGLAACLDALDPGPPTLVLSLEDFYLDPAERERRGVPWRAMPGSHDLVRLQEVMAAIQDRRQTFAVPRYDMASDRKLEDQAVTGLGHCVIEGWLVGCEEFGYNVLADKIDFLLYLDAASMSLRKWRFMREARIVDRSQGKLGYPLETLTQFWDKVLGPGIETWVRGCASRANVRIVLNRERYVVDAIPRHAAGPPPC